MTATKAVMNVIPLAMAAGLAEHNLSYLRKKKKKRGLLGLGFDNIVGAAMIQETSDFLGGID